MSERSAALKTRLRGGEVTIGGWLSLPDLSVAEILAGVGFDWLLIDAEHGAFDLGTLQTVMAGFRGTTTVPIVRVPWNDAVRIKQVLDLGAEGVLVPQVGSAEEARAAVAACKYPPDGIRGFGPRRASDWGRNIDRYVGTANDEIVVILQVESVAMANDIDTMLDVPGVDVICLGPNDLSGSVGLLRQTGHPTVAGAIAHVHARCLARGMPLCAGVTVAPDRMAESIASGANFVIAMEDSALLAASAAQALAAARAIRRTP
jgi:2-keto-3-deoxy-L-rhamnonate aldolase RhmA